MSEANEAVVVPATSANLGCAFDCAALAVNLYLKVRGRLTAEEGFRCRYRGPNAARIPEGEANLVARAARAACERAGVEIRGGEIEIENEIPVAAGLGSSAAAIVAGILLATRHLGQEPDEETTLRLACELEGHPDNVAAAFCGGLAIAARESDGRVRVVRAALPETLELVAVVPERELATGHARAALPENYSRQDAVHNLQRVALLVAACFSGAFQFDPELFHDRLHQPYRAPLVPGLAECLAVRHPDLGGVFLSGAGASVLAIVRRNAGEIGNRLAAEFRRHGVGCRVLPLRPENRGGRDFFLENHERSDVLDA